MNRSTDTETMPNLAKRLTLFSLILFPFLLFAQQKVAVVKLMDEVSPSSARHVIKGMEFAQENEADLILLHMNTYGGLVDDCDTIRARILNSEIPVWVFIDKNAASAGAIISIACDKIFMSPGASMGAATVVNGTTGEALPDKYQSYWRGIVRATAQEKGRDPAIAEKMIDQNLEIEGLSPVGQVITFTPEEAIENGYCEGIRDNVKDVLDQEGYTQAEIISYEGSSVDTVIEFLLNPAVSAILIMLIVGGVWWEIKTPGVGLPAGVAALAAAMYFGPHYMEGLAEYWEIGLFFLGVLLLATEIFVTPGFGVTGALGIGSMVTGLAITMVKNVGMDFTAVAGIDMLSSFALVLLALTTSILGVVWIVKRFVKAKRLHPIVDTTAQRIEEGYTSLDNSFKDLLEREGSALTDLKPAGFIEIDGKRLDAMSEGGYINKGASVKVIELRSTALVVREITPQLDTPQA